MKKGRYKGEKSHFIVKIGANWFLHSAVHTSILRYQYNLTHASASPLIALLKSVFEPSKKEKKNQFSE